MKKRVQSRNASGMIRFVFLVILIMILLIQNIPQIGESFLEKGSNTFDSDYGSVIYFELIEPLENENLTSFPKSEYQFNKTFFRYIGSAGCEDFVVLRAPGIVFYLYLCVIGLISVVMISQKCLITRHDKDGEK